MARDHCKGCKLMANFFYNLNNIKARVIQGADLIRVTYRCCLVIGSTSYMSADVSGDVCIYCKGLI